MEEPLQLEVHVQSHSRGSLRYGRSRGSADDAEDNQSWLGLDETPIPVNPVVPSMQGTVVLACFLEGNGKELPVNVRDLYGMRGIRVILRQPWQDLRRERIPCNMNYIERKVAELQSMPKEE